MIHGYRNKDAGKAPLNKKNSMKRALLPVPQKVIVHTTKKRICVLERKKKRQLERPYDGQYPITHS